MNVRVYQNRHGTVFVSHAIRALRLIPSEFVDMVILSPPYYKRRKYDVVVKWPDGWVGELGWEPTPGMYARHIADVMDELSRVTKPGASVFINIDDTKLSGNTPLYFPNNAGEQVDISGIVIEEVRKRGWRLVRKYIVVKGFYDPERGEFFSSIYRQGTKITHHYEYVLHFVRKNELPRIRGHLPSDVILLKKDYVTTTEHHSSQFPLSLPMTFIKNFTEPGDVVLDPFAGVGTTGIAAIKLRRKFILIEAVERNLLMKELRF